MDNPCGTARANILEYAEINGVKVYFGAGVNPVNSPAQFFVAWGNNVLANGLIHTFNCDTPDEGFLWFIDDELAEQKFRVIQQKLAMGSRI